MLLNLANSCGDTLTRKPLSLGSEGRDESGRLVNIALKETAQIYWGSWVIISSSVSNDALGSKRAGQRKTKGQFLTLMLRNVSTRLARESLHTAWNMEATTLGANLPNSF